MSSEIMKVLLCVVLFCSLTDASRVIPKGCFNQTELQKYGKSFLKKQLHRSGFYIVPTPSSLERMGYRQHKCDTFQLQPSSPDYKNRALSPWRYRIDEDNSRYPPTIAVAECLCEGCIINGVQDFSYNSELVKQTIIVAKYTECPSDPRKYSIQPVQLEIGVGCTCVVPRR